MTSLLERIDKTLVDLAWSLWSELGVAGIDRKHKNCLIALEELILLTVVVAESDPRLRDEALDWCSKYHHFVSVSRLRTLVNELGEQVYESFSIFAETLNLQAQTKWPVFAKVNPLRVVLSGKSTLPSCEAPALLVLRLRALFGVGIRADLLVFCLTQGPNSFTAAETVKIGYNKRSLAEVLESFVQSGLLISSKVGNRWEYTLAKHDELVSLIGHLPEIAPDWSSLIEVMITLRTILSKHQDYSVSSRGIVLINALDQLKNNLQALRLLPPSFSPDLNKYWESFCQWFLDTLREIAQGNFFRGFAVRSVEIINEQVCSLMQHLYLIQDCLDGLEHSMSFASEKPLEHSEVFKQNYAFAMEFLKDLLKSIDDLYKFPVYSLNDIQLLEILFRFGWEELAVFRGDIEKLLTANEIVTTHNALRQFQVLRVILNKFHSFMYRFTERLKKFYFTHTDVHLLTLAPELIRRHKVIRLFSDKH